MTQILSPRVARERTRTLRRSSLLVIRDPDKGRAIVAARPIRAGEVIETAPAACFPPGERTMLEGTQIFQYYFVRPDDYRDSGHVAGYIVFGLASLCNHADSPSAVVDWTEDAVGHWATLTALRDIPEGGEVTLFYTNLLEYPNLADFK